MAEQAWQEELARRHTKSAAVAASAALVAGMVAQSTMAERTVSRWVTQCMHLIVPVPAAVDAVRAGPGCIVTWQLLHTGVCCDPDIHNHALSVLQTVSSKADIAQMYVGKSVVRASRKRLRFDETELVPPPSNFDLHDPNRWHLDSFSRVAQNMPHYSCCTPSAW